MTIRPFSSLDEAEVNEHLQAFYKQLNTNDLLEKRATLWNDLYQTVWYISPINRAWMQLRLAIIYKELHERRDKG